MFKEIVDDAQHWEITKAHHEHFVLRRAKKGCCIKPVVLKLVVSNTGLTVFYQITKF